MRPNRERTSATAASTAAASVTSTFAALGGGRARRLEVGDEGGGLRLVHVPHGHGAAALGEALCRGAADPGRAAGDDDDAHRQNVTLHAELELARRKRRGVIAEVRVRLVRRPPGSRSSGPP